MSVMALLCAQFFLTQFGEEAATICGLLGQ